MRVSRSVPRVAVAAACFILFAAPVVRAAELQGQPATAPLTVTVGKSLVLDNALNIQRLSIANGELAEAVAVNPKEVLINAKMPGETTLVIWQQGGPRLMYDLVVRASSTRLENVRQQIARELPGQDISLSIEGTDNVYLRGTAKDMVAAARAVNIATTLGKVVNLLNVEVPPVESQILLRVRFADVDRTSSSQLGVNLFSLGATNTIGGVTTQQFTPPLISDNGGIPQATLTDALNIFLFRPDLNLGGTIKALQARNLLQILAEPNLLATNGKPASFLAGGEFPVPVIQGGANVGAVTIQFREFGVRINFIPTITPRGTIHLQVAPEVSSLDYSNAVVLQGFTVPAIATRRVQTEVELESGQSFALAGLLDNRMNEAFTRIPGIGNIPILGKLFQSRLKNKNNSELLVMVTPELVRPIPEGAPVPVVKMPEPPLKGTATEAPRTPGIQSTGPVPVKPLNETVPMEQLLEIKRKEDAAAQGTAMPTMQPIAPATPAAPAPAQPAAPAPSQPTGSSH
ncbi:MAG: pilus assembly protein N-terminal domain-containing protein [Bryobacteraceae bacterium]